VPFGFRVGDDGALVPDAAEQALIAHARALRADGATLRAIQAVLETQHGRKRDHQGDAGKCLEPRRVARLAAGRWVSIAVNAMPIVEASGAAEVSQNAMDRPPTRIARSLEKAPRQIADRELRHDP
jgi:hypothetical protein